MNCRRYSLVVIGSLSLLSGISNWPGDIESVRHLCQPRPLLIIFFSFLPSGYEHPFSSHVTCGAKCLGPKVMSNGAVGYYPLESFRLFYEISASLLLIHGNRFRISAATSLFQYGEPRDLLSPLSRFSALPGGLLAVFWHGSGSALILMLH